MKNTSPREDFKPVVFDENLICDGPDNYKNILIKNLRSKDFYCPGNHLKIVQI